jgi:hypothetical protein
MGWEFDYEPALDLNGWLPDFILYASKFNGGENGEEIQHKILVEVKPYSTIGEFKSMQQKIDRAILGTDWDHCEILLLGSSIFKSSHWTGDNDFDTRGIIGWFYQISTVPKQAPRERVISEAYPIGISLEKGKAFDLTDSDMFSRFNGYWDHSYGSSYCFDWAHPLDYSELKEFWDDAGNEVRWIKKKSLVSI